jgi:hypothetical protein
MRNPDPSPKPFSDDYLLRDGFHQVARYSYTDASGVELFQKLRYEQQPEPGEPKPNKTFRFRHRIGKDWYWSMGDGGEQPLYRLEDVSNADPGAPVYLCESEKVCNKLAKLGLIATCCATAWNNNTDVAPLRGRKLRLLVDNDVDGAGENKAAAALDVLKPVAASIRVVRGGPPGGNLADRLDDDITIEEFDALCGKAPEQQPEPEDESRRARFTTFDECLNPTPKRWLIKNVMAKGETSAWVGPPGGGKSALLTDIAIAIAAVMSEGRTWRGYRIKERCGVLYIPYERRDLVLRKLAAYAHRSGLKGLPIAVCNEFINLLDPRCVEAVAKTVRAAEARVNCAVGLIVIDPTSKAIALGGGDEDKAKDQNILLANLRAIQNKLDVHIAGIGHTGKDESRGQRGSNAPLGDVDVFVQITGDAIKTATITKANDQPEGPLTTFQLEPFDFERDKDGDPFSTWIVSEQTFDGMPARPAKARKLPGTATIALRALREAVEAVGAVPPASNNIPPNIRVTTFDQWRDYAYRLGISASKEARARQKAFERATERLIADKLVGVWNEQAWSKTATD